MNDWMDLPQTLWAPRAMELKHELWRMITSIINRIAVDVGEGKEKIFVSTE
jgi:hypothetical protein